MNFLGIKIRYKYNKIYNILYIKKMTLPLLQELSNYIATQLSTTKLLKNKKYQAQTILQFLSSTSLTEYLNYEYPFTNHMTDLERASFFAGMDVENKSYVIDNVMQYLM
jgi:hypothetical protein